MASGISELISKFVPGLKEMLRQPAQRTESSIYSGHKRLFDLYGISPDVLKPITKKGVTELNTEDGILSIYWDKRVIVPPKHYYTS